MKTYKLTLEVFEEKKSTITLTADENVLTSEMVCKIVDILFEDKGNNI